MAFFGRPSNILRNLLKLDFADEFLVALLDVACAFVDVLENGAPSFCGSGVGVPGAGKFPTFTSD